MGNTLKKIQSDGFINWQHRPLIPNNPTATAQGQWISYSSELSHEFEEAIADESNEPVWTIQESAIYHGDQLLFGGDIATRLGGPFIHRGATDKSIRQLRSVANGFFFQDKGTFELASKDVPNQVQDKAVLLNSVSCQTLYRELYKIANHDFQIDDDANIANTFVPVKDTKGLVPNKHPNASANFFQIQLTDEKNQKHIVIVQQYDFDLVTVEQAILPCLQNIDSKLAALLIEEARISLIIEHMSKVLCIANGSCFQKVEVEIDSTMSRSKK